MEQLPPPPAGGQATSSHAVGGKKEGKGSKVQQKGCCRCLPQKVVSNKLPLHYCTVVITLLLSLELGQKEEFSSPGKLQC